MGMASSSDDDPSSVVDNLSMGIFHARAMSYFVSYCLEEIHQCRSVHLLNRLITLSAFVAAAPTCTDDGLTGRWTLGPSRHC